ncbi:aldehyde dehydrogenase family protein [Peribacillus psychrosaccharolyticus]|uniref:aldehyde dehydrogenase family protein n=1 Tax=Peribacillus psychrosaccharolyticus TaxID=1407 RepID=UPI003D270C14
MIIAKDLKKFLNIINGNLVPASTGEYMDSIDPATGHVWATIPCSTIQDAEDAVESAKAAFEKWSTMPASERAVYLRKIGDLITQHGEELSELETRDNGWVVRETKYGLIPSLASFWYDAAAGATEVGSKGDTVQLGPSGVGYTLREPLGVVVGILPWNAPLSTFTFKAAVALAAGNTVIIKPSELGSVSSLRFGELINEILPPGTLNVISGIGRDVGDILVSHQDVSKISVTGSGQTAKAIAQSTASNPKPMILELGGKSPNIVFADADLDKAAQGVTNGIFSGNAGQLCAAGSRILIQKPIYDEMIIKMKEVIAQTIKLGDPLNPESSMGPIANSTQYEKICAYIELGKDEGGETIIGGRYGGSVLLPEQPQFSDGYWVEPTLIHVNSNTLRICQEEIFGPVATVIPFDTEEEALAIANESSLGLVAGVWTTNLSRAHRMMRKLESGTVWVNTYFRIGPELPFGGTKGSGFGSDSILEYTREKTCYIDIG